ncbi:MAG TPA: metalloregulator ArsR/SmtB family transcription factor [Candidatus Dormibacteraeota bacterium]|nr:metalloregulator ArsR/SmtB family transcription factor [Candidatus Dormibacteraeota bacterium]
MPASSENVVRAQIRVAPSAPIELMWLIHWAGANHAHGGEFATLEELRRRRGSDLEKLWSGRASQYSTELLVLAHRSGSMLDQDLKRLFNGIDAAIDEQGGLPSLQSESPAERELVRERLEKLRSDRAFRRRYVELLSGIWSEMEGEWESIGRPAVLAEIQKWTRALDGGAPYRQLLQVQRIWPPRPETDTFADAAAAEGNLVLTPAWFGGKIHVLEFDGLMYLGRGVRFGEPSVKEVATEISFHMKALADPTRLAILLRLARDPASVTELARQFNLSQPTVSAHVQVLREVGLIEERTVGRSAQLSANEDALRNMLAHTEDILVRAFRD